MNVVQRVMVAIALVWLFVALSRVNYTVEWYDGRVLQAQRALHTPIATNFRAPIWSPPDEEDVARVVNTGRATPISIVVKEARLHAGPIGVTLGIIASVTFALVALTSSRRRHL